MSEELPEQPVEEARAHADLADVTDAELEAARSQLPPILDDEDVEDVEADESNPSTHPRDVLGNAEDVTAVDVVEDGVAWDDVEGVAWDDVEGGTWSDIEHGPAGGVDE